MVLIVEKLLKLNHSFNKASTRHIFFNAIKKWKDYDAEGSKLKFKKS